jgi:hypothetical protein
MEVFSSRETRWKSHISHLEDGSPVGMIRTLSSGMQVLIGEQARDHIS